MNRESIVKLISALLRRRSTPDEIVDALASEGLLNVSYGSQDVSLVVDKFKLAFGTTRTTKWDRYAANRLVKKYGSESVVMLMLQLADNSSHPYAPVVNSVGDVERKWNSILAFINRNQGSEDIDV